MTGVQESHRDTYDEGNREEGWGSTGHTKEVEGEKGKDSRTSRSRHSRDGGGIVVSQDRVRHRRLFDHTRLVKYLLGPNYKLGVSLNREFTVTYPP